MRWKKFTNLQMGMIYTQVLKVAGATPADLKDVEAELGQMVMLFAGFRWDTDTDQYIIINSSNKTATISE